MNAKLDTLKIQQLIKIIRGLSS